MNCILTVLAVYSVVCTLGVIILGSMLFSAGDVEESLMDCRDLQVDGPVTEVRNKIVKFDILNQDNSRIGLGEEKECPVCATGWLTLLEILALVILGILSCINLGRFGRYLKKLHAKRVLKKENEKIKKKAELRETVLAELSLERGSQRVPRNVGNDKDDMVSKVPTWEEVTLA